MQQLNPGVSKEEVIDEELFREIGSLLPDNEHLPIKLTGGEHNEQNKKNHGGSGLL